MDTPSPMDKTIVAEARDTKAPLPYETLGAYKLVKLLGQGGMGRVFLVRHNNMSRLSALKLLPQELSSDRGFQTRFRHEAQTLANLSHQNIVTVYNFDCSHQEYFLEMEYIDGGDLQKKIQNQGTLSPKETKRILTQILEALEYAHGKSVIHRDLKPANILLKSDGTVKISDFGLAAFLGEDMQKSFLQKSIALARTRTNEDLDAVSYGSSLAGTLLYMSPQAMRGEKPSPQDDLYAVGVIAYYMLTGKLPNVSYRPPSRLIRGLSSRWDSFIGKCIEEKTEDRFASASEALKVLRQIDQAWNLSTPLLVAVAGLAVVGVVFGLSVALQTDAPPQTFEYKVIPEQKPPTAVDTSRVVFLEMRCNVNPSRVEIKDKDDVTVASLYPNFPHTVKLRYDGAPYRVEFSQPGWQSEVLNWHPDSGSAILAVVMERLAITKQFHFTSQPSGAAVICGDKSLGFTPCDADITFTRVDKSQAWESVRLLLTHPETYESVLELQESSPARVETVVLLPKDKKLIIKLPNGAEMNFIRIPPGKFIMGSPPGEIGRKPDESQQEIEISYSFFMQETEVTQEQYVAIVGDNPSYYRHKSSRQPVEQVTFDAIVGPTGFLEKFNEFLKKNYTGYIAKLPTEAQWEYACRAGTKSSFSNGYNLTSTTRQDTAIDRIAIYGSSKPENVASREPNGWGLYDMHGNVWEWTSEGILRGGSFQEGPSACRSASRWREQKNNTKADNRCGFRLIIERMAK